MEYKFEVGDKVRIKEGSDLSRVKIRTCPSELKGELSILTQDAHEASYRELFVGIPFYMVTGNWYIQETFLEWADKPAVLPVRYKAVRVDKEGELTSLGVFPGYGIITYEEGKMAVAPEDAAHPCGIFVSPDVESAKRAAVGNRPGIKYQVHEVYPIGECSRDPRQANQKTYPAIVLGKTVYKSESVEAKNISSKCKAILCPCYMSGGVELRIEYKSESVATYKFKTQTWEVACGYKLKQPTESNFSFQIWTKPH